MRKKAILLTAIIFLSLPLSALHIINAQDLNSSDEFITVQHSFGGFETYLDVGSFNASSGNYVGINLFTSSKSTNYSQIEVKIVGANSGVAYDATANSFAQTFQINYNDTYSITIINFNAFYQDLTVSGEIIIYHHPIVLTTNQLSISPTPTPIPTNTPQPLNTTLSGTFDGLGNFQITSPENQTYTTNTLLLNIVGEGLMSDRSGEPLVISYSLDGQGKSPITAKYSQMEDWNFLGGFNQTIALPQLSSGSHNITVYGSYWGYSEQVTVSFSVDTIEPTISFLQSVQNKTYYKNTVTLGYVVNKPSQIIYSLDNYANVTIYSDSSLKLANLTNGQHNVTIFAQDEYGLISFPTTFYFTVEVPSTTVTIVAVASIIVVVGLGFGLVFFRRHQKTANVNQ